MGLANHHELRTVVPTAAWLMRSGDLRNASQLKPLGSDNGPLSSLPDVAFVPRSSVYEPIGSDGSHALPGPKVSTPPCHQRVADARSIERATQSRHPESADLCAASRPAAYGYPAGANSPSLMVFKSPLGHPEWCCITSLQVPLGHADGPADACGLPTALTGPASRHGRQP